MACFKVFWRFRKYGNTGISVLFMGGFSSRLGASPGWFSNAPKPGASALRPGCRKYGNTGISVLFMGEFF